MARTVLAGFGLALLGLLVPCPRAGATLDATTILARARAAATAGGDRSAAFVLEVTAAGWRAERTGRFFKRADGDGRYTLVVLAAPEYLRGVKVLSRVPHAGGAQQWLWMPAAHRPRRVAAGAAGRSLFGTDVDAGDLEQRGPDARATLLGRAIRGGAETWVVALDAGDGADTDEIVWLRASDYRLMRREFRRDGRLLRLYRVDALATVDGIATPVAMTLVNRLARTRSRLRLHDVRYGLALDPALFTLPALDRPVGVIAP